MTITLTPRLSLTKDDTTENYNVGRVNANSDKLDAAVGSTLCLSSTRPIAPFTGQTGHETDISGNIIWTGSAWKYTSPPSFTSQSVMNAAAGPFFNGLLAATNDGIIWLRQAGAWISPMALGVVGGKSIQNGNNLGSAVNSGTEVAISLMETGTVALNPNRRFCIRCVYKAQGTANDNRFLLRIREGATAGTGGNQLRQYVHDTRNAALGYTNEFCTYYESGGTAINRVFTLTALRLDGVGNLQFSGGDTGLTNLVGLYVEDVGPAGKLTTVSS